MAVKGYSSGLFHHENSQVSKWKKGHGQEHSCHSAWPCSTCRHHTCLAQLQMSQVPLTVLEHQELWPGPVSIKARHKSLAVQPGICQEHPWGQHRAACRHWAPTTSQWPAMAKTRHAGTASGCKSRQRKDVPPRTETCSHPIKLAVLVMPNLSAAWEEASVRSLLGRAGRAHQQCWEQHTQQGLVSGKWGWAMAALLHFITRLKDPALEKNFLREKKKKEFWPALAFLTINLFKATDWEDLRALLKILTKNWLLHSEFVPLPSCSWERLRSCLFPKGQEKYCGYLYYKVFSHHHYVCVLRK